MVTAVSTDTERSVPAIYVRYPFSYLFPTNCKLVHTNKFSYCKRKSFRRRQISYFSFKGKAFRSSPPAKVGEKALKPNHVDIGRVNEQFLQKWLRKSKRNLVAKKARTYEWVIVTYGRFLVDRRAPRVTKATCTF